MKRMIATPPGQPARIEGFTAAEIAEREAAIAAEGAARPAREAALALDASDKTMARIAEDVIDALIAKGLVADADLPAAAVAKITERKELRKKL